MLRNAALAVGLVLGLNADLTAQTPGPENGRPGFTLGMRIGYHSGLGYEAYGVLSDFARGFPLSARFGLGRTAVPPGSAWDARRIFINDATNGSPEKSGKTWDFKLDLLHPVHVLGLERAHLFAGVRYAKFTGNFVFIGGNEDFDVRSSHFGLGSGLESYFGISRRVDMVLAASAEYFFPGSLRGHDTVYSPDGEHQNPRADYTYADADAAIGQPKLEPAVMVGFQIRL